MDDSRSNIPVPVKLIFLGTAAAAWAYAVRQKRRMEFAGKVVVISGASRGLGLELARGFASEHRSSGSRPGALDGERRRTHKLRDTSISAALRREPARASPKQRSCDCSRIRSH